VQFALKIVIRGKNANAIIIFKYPHLHNYYPIFAYEITCVLDYYLNLYVRLINAVITIYKLK
jgi:hypothetical protein